MIDSRILQLLLAKGVGDVTIKKFFSFIKSKDCSVEEAFASKTIFCELGIKADIISSIFSNEIIEKANTLTNELNSQNIHMITEINSNYPQHLKSVLGKESPPVLFAKGNLSLLNNDAVGFCGSRKASSKGISIAEDCARQLAEKKVTIISGYAAGTDIAAHRASLQYGGNTIFVLAEGILRSKIKNEVKNLLDNTNYLFLSQFLPTTTWNAGNAMKRNKVIIGLSRAMILVESGKTGGTFAAGEESLRTGCPLFVIDFAKPEVSAEANPYFIQSGGMPIRGKNGIPNMEKVFSVIRVQKQSLEATVASKEDNTTNPIAYEQMKIEI